MTDKEYLDKAIEYIIEFLDGDDKVCEKLLSIPEEHELCALDCKNLDRFCLYRFLKYYKRCDKVKIIVVKEDIT
jgi:hypothetical protein